ncbi:hypothetical protein VTK73DRAFT_8802 [Phialemonium thermophilum]|uniref:Uncharacterized protein n=1 Tax=Phialemonium thermophilum TaxID=223376 RepID=A0ABR3W638_9PEZI
MDSSKASFPAAALAGSSEKAGPGHIPRPPSPQPTPAIISPNQISPELSDHKSLEMHQQHHSGPDFRPYTVPYSGSGGIDVGYAWIPASRVVAGSEYGSASSGNDSLRSGIAVLRERLSLRETRSVLPRLSIRSRPSKRPTTPLIYTRSASHTCGAVQKRDASVSGSLVSDGTSRRSESKIETPSEKTTSHESGIDDDWYDCGAESEDDAEWEDLGVSKA